MSGSLFVAALILTAAMGQDSADPAVEEIGRLLAPPARGLPNRYPWYDASTDSVKPLTPPKPPEHDELGFLERLSRGFGSVADAGFIALMWLLGICVVGGLIYYAYRVLSNRRSQIIDIDIQQTPDQPDRVEQLPVQIKKRVDNFLAEAEKCVAAGNLSEAIVYYFSHVLLILDRAGAIHLSRGKTNRRYFKELSGNLPQLSDHFRTSIELFEDAFFGHLPVDRDRFIALWEERNRFAATVEGKR